MLKKQCYFGVSYVTNYLMLAQMAHFRPSRTFQTPEFSCFIYPDPSTFPKKNIFPLQWSRRVGPACSGRVSPPVLDVLGPNQPPCKL